MSKFTEYLALLPKGLKSAKKIIEGVSNDVKLENGSLSKDKQDEIIRRRLICSMCPLNSINAQSSKEYKELFGKNYETKREDLHCSVCSCNIKLKTSSLDSDCGLTDYNEQHPENLQELKWKKYVKD